MNYKIIDESLYKKIFPKGNTRDNINLYSFYRFGVEKYLDKVLFLGELNKSFKDNGLGIFVKTIYNNISNLDLEYVFVINNFYLDKLSEDDYLRLKDIYNMDDFDGLLDFVSKTFKTIMDNNGILMLGVLVKSDSRVSSFLKEKSETYLEILNIPVRFINFYEEIEKKQEEILKKYPKFLPIGSVVMLKDASKKLMIIGFSIIDMDNKDKIYDYLGCIYPDGVMDNNTNIVFNHEDIKSIVAIGYKSDEENNFISDLIKTVSVPDYEKEILESIK